MTANFYRLRHRLSAASVTELFRQLRAAARSPSQNLFRHRRQRTDGATWSAIAFFHDRDPAFLRPPPPGQTERTCSYLLLVEHRHHIAVFKSGLELPSSFKTKALERVPHERVEAATARKDEIFEKIRLRNMSPSKLVLRSKTLEAGDLSNSVGPSGGPSCDRHHRAHLQDQSASGKRDSSAQRQIAQNRLRARNGRRGDRNAAAKARQLWAFCPSTEILRLGRVRGGPGRWGIGAGRCG
jgi:hypothetical protein